MKKIAALTMARNDDFYLRKWVAYYGAQLGKENLYIYLDGLDQVVAPFCEGTHAKAVEKIGTQVVSAEKGRLKFLSGKAAELLSGGYDLVIGVDADEFIVVDPKLGKSLREYLSEVKVRGSLSALGLDFGQKLGEEPDITEDEPFLRQRHYAQIGTRYTKPSILAEPLTWGSGFSQRFVPLPFRLLRHEAPAGPFPGQRPPGAGLGQAHAETLARHPAGH